MSRPRLFERLAAPARVIVVSAPPGSGKTVLLRSWVAQSGLADRAAWVTVGRGERDPQQFWLAVLDALRQTAPGSVLVRPLTAAPDLDGGAIAERLLTDLAPFGGVRSPSLRQVALRLAVLAGYAVVSGLLGALLFGPARPRRPLACRRSWARGATGGHPKGQDSSVNLGYGLARPRTTDVTGTRAR